MPHGTGHHPGIRLVIHRPQSDPRERAGGVVIPLVPPACLEVVFSAGLRSQLFGGDEFLTCAERREFTADIEVVFFGFASAADVGRAQIARFAAFAFEDEMGRGQPVLEAVHNARFEVAREWDFKTFPGTNERKPHFPNVEPGLSCFGRERFRWPR